jgi:hypothetical protein
MKSLWQRMRMTWMSSSSISEWADGEMEAWKSEVLTSPVDTSSVGDESSVAGSRLDGG